MSVSKPTSISLAHAEHHIFGLLNAVIVGNRSHWKYLPDSGSIDRTEGMGFKVGGAIDIERRVTKANVREHGGAVGQFELLKLVGSAMRLLNKALVSPKYSRCRCARTAMRTESHYARNGIGV